MRKLFDHRCESCGEVSEHLVEDEEKLVSCPSCGGDATRIISAVALDNKMGLDPDFPTAYSRYGKDMKRRHL